MSISYIALNRMMEERAVQDEAYRRLLKRNSKCTVSDGRRLSDEALVDKLRALGLTNFHRDWLDRSSRKVPSAQVLATALVELGGFDVPPEEEDWLWVALACLWERWFPDRLNFEMLDDWMQAGYDAKERNEPLETVRLWCQVWNGVQSLMTGFKIGTIEEFDDWFGGTNCVFNWVQDYSAALYRASLTDQSFARERVKLCRTVQDLAAKSEHDKSLVGYFRRDLVESLADLGDYASVDRLYTEWLRDDPQWGWGWIGWSDAYFTFAPEGRSDAARAERILSDGLSVADVRDRANLVERLANLYEETGRAAEVAALRDRHGDRQDVSGEQVRARGEVEPACQGPSDAELDAIIAELDAEYTGILPEQAIHAAQRHRVEITPRLIALIRKATALARAGSPIDGNGQLIALFLLAEFEAKEALPVILEAITLPGEGPFDLFGDAITEGLSSILAALAVDMPEVIDHLIGNRSITEYVRWQAAATYLYWVRDGLLTREQAVQRLRGHLLDAIANHDVEGARGWCANLSRMRRARRWMKSRRRFVANSSRRAWQASTRSRKALLKGNRRFRGS